MAEPLDLKHLAEVAHLSPFHWHRVYQALNGESIATTVRMGGMTDYMKA